MAIHLPILVSLNERRFKRETAELAGKLGDIGEAHGDAYARGMGRSRQSITDALTPDARRLKQGMERLGVDMNDVLAKRLGSSHKVHRSMDRVIDALDGVKEKTNELSKAEQRRAKIAERNLFLQATTEQQHERNNKLLEREINLVDAAAKARRDSAAEFGKQEKEIEALRRQHLKTAETLKKNPSTSNRRRHERQAADIEQAMTDLTETKARATAYANDLDKAAIEVRRQLNQSAKEYTATLDDLAKSQNNIRQSDEDVLRRGKEIDKMHRRRLDNMRSLRDAITDEPGGGSGGGKGGRGKRFNGLSTTLSAFPGVPGGLSPAIGGTVMVGIIGAAGVMAKAVVTASQSIWLLPAAAGAAGAAMGTLAIATHGFGDAIQNMGDPKKFAEALQGLSPNAQQAALSIKTLVDGPLGDLKAATQDAFFSGMGEQIWNLTDTFKNPLQGLTTSIATSFNDTFKGVTDHLMNPEMFATIQHIFDNISASFQQMAPAATSFTDALVRIMSVGSDFLPGLAKGIADAAHGFSVFIQNAQQSGKLREWISSGLQAVKEIGSAIWEVGKRIYDAFAVTNMSDFKAGLKSIVDVVGLLIDTVQTLGQIVNFLSQHREILVAIIALWGGFKLLGLAGHVAEIANAFRGLPDAAKMAAGGITRALGMIAIPAALLAVIEWEDRNQTETALREGKTEMLPIGPRGMMVPVKPRGGPTTQPDNGSTPSESPRGLGGFRPAPPGVGRRAGGIGPHPGHIPVPGVPSELSDTEQYEAFWASHDPNAFLPPGMQGSTPGGQTNPQVQWGTGGEPFESPGYGYYNVDQDKIKDAVEDVRKQGLDLRDARMKEAFLNQKADASALEKSQAAEDSLDAGWAYQEALDKLAEAQKGTWKKLSKSAAEMTDGLQQIGAKLDDDFGISKGLPGIIENLVKMLGNLAFAPVIGALSGVTAAYGTAGPGTGLLGAFAPRQNMFGQIMPNILGQLLPTKDSQGWLPNGSIPTSGLSPVSLTNLPNADGAHEQIAAAAKLAQSMGLQLTSGKNNHVDDGGFHPAGMAGDFSNGSGNTPEMLAFANTMATNFQPMIQELIYSDPQFSKNIGDGNIVSGTNYYDAKTLSEHRDHVHLAIKDEYAQAFKQALGAGGMLTGSPGTGSLGNFSGATPVYVVNMPGGGAFNMAGPGGVAGAALAKPGKDAVAANFIAQASAAGLNREQTIAGLAVLSQESDMGANPAAYRPQNQNGTPGIMGPFQQDNSYAKYGNRNDPSVASKGFIDQYMNTGAGLNNPNPWAQALAVQRPASAAAGGYDAASLYAGQYNTAASYYDRLAGGLPPGTAGSSGLGLPIPLNGPKFDFGGGSNPGDHGAPPSMGSPGTIGNTDLRDLLGAPGGADMSPGSAFPMPGASVQGIARPGPAVLGSMAGLSPGTLSTGTRSTDSLGIPMTQGMSPSPGIGLSGGGLLGMASSAASAAAGAAGMAAGGGGAGASAGAQIAIDLTNRALSFGAQAAGIGVQGILETFLPVSSELASPLNGWFGKILGGVAGIRPVSDNLAGLMTKQNAPADGAQPLTPEQAQAQKAKDAEINNNNTSNNVNIDYTANGMTPDENAATAANLAQKSYVQAGQR